MSWNRKKIAGEDLKITFYTSDQFGNQKEKVRKWEKFAGKGDGKKMYRKNTRLLQNQELFAAEMKRTTAKGDWSCVRYKPFMVNVNIIMTQRYPALYLQRCY